MGRRKSKKVSVRLKPVGAGVREWRILAIGRMERERCGVKLPLSVVVVCSGAAARVCVRPLAHHLTHSQPEKLVRLKTMLKSEQGTSSVSVRTGQRFGREKGKQCRPISTSQDCVG